MKHTKAIRREPNDVTGTDGYYIYTKGVRDSGHFGSVLSCLEWIESPEYAMEALAYTALGPGCEVPTNRELGAARGGREAMHAAIRDADDNRFSWKESGA